MAIKTCDFFQILQKQTLHQALPIGFQKVVREVLKCFAELAEKESLAGIELQREVVIGRSENVDVAEIDGEWRTGTGRQCERFFVKSYLTRAALLGSPGRILKFELA